MPQDAAPSLTDPSDESWFPGASNDAAGTLGQHHANRNLLKTELFTRFVLAARPDCATAQRFIGAVRRWRRASPGAVAAVMMTPWYDHWACRATELRQDAERHGTSGSPSAGQQFSAAIIALLLDHSRFDAALAIRTRSAASGVASLWDRHLPLNDWGVAVPGPDSSSCPWEVGIRDSRLILQVGAGVFPVDWLFRGGLIEDQRYDALRVGTRLGQGGSLLLLEGHRDSETTIAIADYLPSLNQPSRIASAPDAFVSMVSTALELLGRHWPSVQQDLFASTHVLVPRTGARNRRVAIPGVLECRGRTPARIAEDMVAGLAQHVLAPLWDRGNLLASEAINAGLQDGVAIQLAVSSALGRERRARYLARQALTTGAAVDYLARARRLAQASVSQCAALTVTAPRLPLTLDLVGGIRDRASRLLSRLSA